MARTIAEISDSLKQSFLSNTALMALYGNNAPTLSPTSIEGRLINIVATAIAPVENMFDWFKKDITKAVETERYGYAGWYEKTAKLFRYGQEISPDYSPNGSFAESTLYSDDGLTPQDIAELQIIKYAFAAENPTGIGVTVKIATENNGSIAQVNPDTVLPVFKAYMNRIKPAGIPLKVINEPAEILSVNIKVWYDPLVMNSNGATITGGIKPVEDALKSYLKSIEFAGEFVVMKMVDVVQNVDGVKVVAFVSATATAGATVTQITDRHTPVSGYMKIPDSMNGVTIQYISENS